MPSHNLLPRWRGFNLLDFFTTRSSCRQDEEDYRIIADLGFNFVRLPLCYLLWTDPADWRVIDERVVRNLDEAIGMGRRHGIHMNLNFHRAPGYSVNPERQEPFDLWADDEARDAFCYHWAFFARRYKGIPSNELSFNLVNEPANRPGQPLRREQYEQVVRLGVAAIAAEDPDRLVIADGMDWGTEPCPELADLPIAQSCRGYRPAGITHYMASWARGETFPPPVWPGAWDGEGRICARADLEEHVGRWAELMATGVGVHCGEFGAYNRTPHPIVLAWMQDLMEILAGHEIGYALWNLKGGFGIFDSGREDVVYENFHGRKLDRAMLNLLQRF